MPKESRNIRKTRIKQALLNQLETSGKTDDYWHDLVLDYLAFWEIKEKLKVDIERNGIMTTVQNGSQVFRKRNDALVELPKIHKRMTDVLEVLDIKPVEGEPDGDDY